MQSDSGEGNDGTQLAEQRRHRRDDTRLGVVPPVRTDNDGTAYASDDDVACEAHDMYMVVSKRAALILLNDNLTLRI